MHTFEHGYTTGSQREIITLAAYSGKRNLTVWLQSVCPVFFLTLMSVGYIARRILNVTHQRQHATRPAYISAQQYKKTGILVFSRVAFCYLACRRIPPRPSPRRKDFYKCAT